MIDNYEYYGVYETLARNGYQELSTLTINNSNIADHIEWILNIFRDGVETDEFKRMKLRVTFADNYTCSIYISYYLFNLFHWSSIVAMDGLIYSKHIYFPENVTMGYNARYINEWSVRDNYGLVDKIRLNRAINTALAYYKHINEFSFYLCNTIALEDDIKLMKANREVYDIMHCDLSGLSLEDIKAEGVRLTKRLIDIIYHDPYHCFGEMFRTGVGINAKQYKENCVNVGPKPNGEGGIFSAPVNSNLMYQAGLKNLLNMIIEYSGGRQAQIINQKNVGTSGAFARILKLNSMDTFLNQDPNYVCNTKNFIPITLKDEKLLKFFAGMTYRTHQNGIDYVLDERDSSLIGETLLFRSAMTCASHARGDGICHCCYGKLAYGNSDVNIGIMGAELLSSVLTQMLLSAKHLLEAIIKKMTWTNEEEFWNIFSLDCNEISLNANTDLSKYKMVISVEEEGDIRLEEDYDDIDFNQYMVQINIEYPDGSIRTYETSNGDHLYLTLVFNELIRKRLNEVDDDGFIKIPLSDLGDMSLFLITIGNNQLSDALNKLQKILNNSKETGKYSKDEILQVFMETIIESNIRIQATHCAVILSNQIRSKEDPLLMPRWEYEDEEYQILTLNGALKKSPSISKTLTYSHIDEMLYSPLTYRKTKPSVMDLIFMTKPQEFLNNDTILDAEEVEASRYLRPGIIMLNQEENTNK